MSDGPSGTLAPNTWGGNGRGGGGEERRKTEGRNWACGSLRSEGGGRRPCPPLLPQPLRLLRYSVLGRPCCSDLVQGLLFPGLHHGRLPDPLHGESPGHPAHPAGAPWQDRPHGSQSPLPTLHEAQRWFGTSVEVGREVVTRTPFRWAWRLSSSCTFPGGPLTM